MTKQAWPGRWETRRRSSRQPSTAAPASASAAEPVGPLPPGAKWQLVVVSHTHWDREWYFPFQTFRFRLVGLMDHLLGLLEREPDFKHFTLDGQTILLEDYLAVRPDRRDDVARFVRDGRLLIGPWYVPPDEYLAGGEALIRNLLWGIRLARELGGAMMVGYSPDAFGHIAYLPALLRGFGIEDAVIWRGAGDDLEKTEFFWQAPDGSEVLTLHMPMGYGFAPLLPDDDVFLAAVLKDFRRRLEPRATTPYLAIMNGVDHIMPQPNLPRVVAVANSFLEDAEMTQGTLPLVLSKVRDFMRGRGEEWPRYRGEFRSSRRSHILPGTLSARMWIKQRNQQCEDRLTRWAEPFSVWSNLLRARLGSDWAEPAIPPGPHTPYPSDLPATTGLLKQAWKYLLQNHDHDAICGCSVDAVHRETAARFDACEQIGEDLTRHALESIAAQTPSEGGQSVVVFNPSEETRTDFVSFRWRQRDGREPYAVADEDGSETPCQVIERPPRQYVMTSAEPPPRLEVGFMARDVPPFGYKTFRLLRGERLRRQPPPPGERSIENEFFRVEAARDGLITVIDKESGRALKGLNRFVDGGDRGDEYAYWAPSHDTIVDAPSRAPTIRVAESGPARFTLQIDQVYSLPVSLARGRERRSVRTVGCRIRTLVRLYLGVRRVEFRTEVDNAARDHRLRVHFPTGVAADVAAAEQHFGVIARPLALPEADETWLEQPVGTYPQKSFVDVSDGKRGVMLANRGLPEYQVLPEAEGATIALTLLRCVGWLCRADMTTRRGLAGPPFLQTPDAQCPGRHTFDYALIPHAGGWQEAFAEARRFGLPMRARPAAGQGTLPPQGSLLEVRPSSVRVSAVKFAEDGSGVIVRLYNIDDRPVRAWVRFHEPYEGVERVTLDERPLGEEPVRNGRVELRLKPSEIVSLLFRAKLWRQAPR